MKSTAKQIAKQRIRILFQKAKEVYCDNPQLAKRYVSTARKIAMSVKISLPTIYKRQICKNCHMLLVYGNNCQVRIKQNRESHILITCRCCDHQTRIPIRNKKEKPRFEQDNY